MDPIATGAGRLFAFLLAVPLALAAFGGPASAQAPERALGAEARRAVTLTVYSGDLALVDEVRRADLAAGRTRLALTDVGTALRPETVLLDAEGLRVLERVFAFDLLTPQRLLEAAVGHKVKVVRTNPETGAETVLDAEVLAVAGGLVLRVGDRIETAEPGRIVFDSLPEGLRTRPTLLAEVEAAAAGPRDLSLSYLTGGLSWQADYVARLDESGTRLDLTGFVTVTNNSGAGFQGAKLRLVAGVVNQAVAVPMLRKEMRMATMDAVAAPQAAGMPSQEAASDRYLYRYERPVDLADRETKQLTLFEAKAVPASRIYRFDNLVNAFNASEEIGPVQAAIMLEVENEKAGNLGRALPGGVVRVYEAAPGGPLFAGEDRIAHTAEGGTLKLNLGQAFDITGTARTTAFERIAKTSFETAQEVVLKNAKDEPVEVKVAGVMPPGWRMLNESAPHEAETAQRIVWTLSVPAKGETTLTYRVRVNQ
jgi:hypothetical protein